MVMVIVMVIVMAIVMATVMVAPVILHSQSDGSGMRVLAIGIPTWPW